MARIRRHRSEPCRLLDRKIGRAHGKVAAGRGFTAKNTISPFDDVQVQLEDASLVEDRFEHERDQRFLGLAPIAALARQEQVLRQLLRNG